MSNISTVRFDLVNLIKIFGLGILFYGLWSIKSFLVILVVSLVISIFIEDFIEKWEQYKIPRVVSVLTFYIVGLFLVFGLAAFFLPVMVSELSRLVQLYPELSGFFSVDMSIFEGQEITTASEFIARLRETPLQKIFSSLGAIFGGVFNLVIILVTSFYLSMNDHGLDKILTLLTPKNLREKVFRVWNKTQKKIGGWFRGQLIIASILVVVTYIGLSLMGIDYALLLALVAGLFGLVPYGIYLGAIPAVGLGISMGGWMTGAFVALFYFVTQLVLDYLIQPLIFKKMTGIPSLLVILSVIIGAKLFGFAGFIIAIPLALFVLEIINEVEETEKQKDTKTEAITETTE